MTLQSYHIMKNSALCILFIFPFHVIINVLRDPTHFFPLLKKNPISCLFYSMSEFFLLTFLHTPLVVSVEVLSDGF